MSRIDLEVVFICWKQGIIKNMIYLFFPRRYTGGKISRFYKMMAQLCSNSCHKQNRQAEILPWNDSLFDYSWIINWLWRPRNKLTIKSQDEKQMNWIGRGHSKNGFGQQVNTFVCQEKNMLSLIPDSYVTKFCRACHILIT